MEVSPNVEGLRSQPHLLGFIILRNNKLEVNDKMS